MTILVIFSTLLLTVSNTLLLIFSSFLSFIGFFIAFLSFSSFLIIFRFLYVSFKTSHFLQKLQICSIFKIFAIKKNRKIFAISLSMNLFQSKSPKFSQFAFGLLFRFLYFDFRTFLFFSQTRRFQTKVSRFCFLFLE